MNKLILLAFFSATILSSSGQPPSSNTSPFELPAATASEGSVYDLDSEWLDQNGKKIKLSELKGNIRILAMGYTSCKFACPRILANIQRIERALIEKNTDLSHVTFSFISIDPETDTPERLKELEKNYQLDPKHWTLLTGDEDGVLELAVALGMKYRKTSTLDFAHSNIITILAADGTLLQQTTGLDADLSKPLDAIQNAISSISKNTPKP